MGAGSEACSLGRGVSEGAGRFLLVGGVEDGKVGTPEERSDSASMSFVSWEIGVSFSASLEIVAGSVWQNAATWPASAMRSSGSRWWRYVNISRATLASSGLGDDRSSLPAA